MSAITTIRNRQRPWARTVLAAFAIIWLNLAIQPCVMAGSIADLPEKDLVHQHNEDSANAITTHSDHVSCPHCAVFGGADCDGAAVCEDDDIVEQRRVVELKDGASKLMAVVPVTNSEWHTPLRALHADMKPLTEAPPLGRPLTVRYCVYLI